MSNCVICFETSTYKCQKCIANYCDQCLINIGVYNINRCSICRQTDWCDKKMMMVVNTIFPIKLTYPDKQDEIAYFGYPKKEIIFNLRKLMKINKNLVKLDDLKDNIVKTFNYMIKCKKFIIDYPSIADVIKQKIKEFYSEHINEATIWYEKLFDEKLHL